MSEFGDLISNIKNEILAQKASQQTSLANFQTIEKSGTISIEYLQTDGGEIWQISEPTVSVSSADNTLFASMYIDGDNSGVEHLWPQLTMKSGSLAFRVLVPDFNEGGHAAYSRWTKNYTYKVVATGNFTLSVTNENWYDN